MITIINPGWLSLIVDGGRYGYGAIGVPPSSALDYYAYRILNLLVGHEGDAPVIEVMGSNFSLTVGADITCAITGARVRAFLNNQPIKPWAAFPMGKGGTLTVQDVEEGFRYYVGFSGNLNLERVISSYSTNLECRFGGLKGSPLKKGDAIAFIDRRMIEPAEIPEIGRSHV
jgi:antagonist of KipI